MNIEFIDILNVGFGVSIVISLNYQGEQIIILLDSGNNDSSIYVDSRRIKIVQYLKQKNIYCIDYAILSHIHRDHIGCYNEIIDTNIKIKNFITNMPLLYSDYNFEEFCSYEDIPTKYIIFSLNEYSRLIKRLEAENSNIIVVKNDIHYNIGDYKLLLVPISEQDQQKHWNHLLSAINPELSIDEKYKFLRCFDSNLNSTTLSIILSKDNENIFYSPGERDLSQSVNCVIDKNVKILHSPHHGDSAYLNNKILSLLNPKWIVVCADSVNTYNLPSDDLEQKIGSYSEICYTETVYSNHQMIHFALPFLEMSYIKL